jgi:hypothetical protein
MRVYSNYKPILWCFNLVDTLSVNSMLTRTVLTRNKVYVDDFLYHAKVIVKGPKGSLNVELQGQALPYEKLEDTTDYTIIERDLQKKVQSCENRTQTPIEKDQKFWKISHLSVDIANHSLVLVNDKE